jgi:uncharacterized repeat protein (TIGR01451 family)
MKSKQLLNFSTSQLLSFPTILTFFFVFFWGDVGWGQYNLQVVEVPNSPFPGLYQATFNPPLSCPNQPATILWGDGCPNNVAPSSGVIHYYQQCGNRQVTYGCPGGNTQTVNIVVDIPTVNIAMSQNLLTGGDCGEEMELVLTLSIDPACGSANQNITFKGTIPDNFIPVAGGDYTVNGQEVSMSVSMLAIPFAPATITRRLKVRAQKLCMGTINGVITLEASTPPGVGLGGSDCVPYYGVLPTESSRKFKFNISLQTPCLRITKEFLDDDGIIQPGEMASFVITVENTGTVAAHNLLVRDYYPQPFQVVANSLPPVSWFNQIVIGTTISTLNPGQSQSLVYMLQHIPPDPINPCAPDVTVNNCATIGLPACDYESEPSCAEIIIRTAVVPPNPGFTWMYTSCNSVQFTSSDTGTGLTHNWTFGNGATSTAANPSNTYTTDGTYTVTHTVTRCGSTTTATQTVVILCGTGGFNCPCVGGNTRNIIANDPISPFFDATLGGVRYSLLENGLNLDLNDDGILDISDHGGCIAILGRLIFDENVEIRDANFRMQPCSEIHVNRVGQGLFPALNINTSHLHGCGNMWRGITVNPSCSLMFSENRIEDAEFAIAANGELGSILQPLTSVTINDNHFLRNHIGVFLQTNNFGRVAHPPIVNNVFEGNNSQAALAPACTAGLPNYGGRGYAGIVTFNNDLLVGVPSGIGNRNTFQRLKNGIIGQNSRVEVYRSDFDDIQWNGFFPTNQSPTVQNSLSIGVATRGGSSIVEFCTFDLCGTTIQGFNNAIHRATRNQWNTIGHGVVANRPSNLRVVGNNGNFGLTAVHAREFAVWEFSNYSISENNLTYGGYPGLTDGSNIRTGFDLANVSSVTLLGRPVIQYNQLLYTPGIGRGGMRINGVGGWNIINNGITNISGGLFGPEGFGFTLSNSNRNRFYENGVRTGIFSNAAFWLTNSTRNLFCCNISENTQTAHRFTSNCDATELYHSDMRGHSFSVDVQEGVIGEQGPPTTENPLGLRWNAFNESSGTARNTAATSILVSFSSFNVTSLDQPAHPENIVAPNEDPFNRWFKVVGGDDRTCEQNAAVCATPIIPVFNNPKGEDKDYRNAIAAGTFKEDDPTLYWEASRSLYRLMQEEPDLASEHPLLKEFYNSATQGKIGAFDQLDAAVADIVRVKADKSVLLKNLQDSFDLYYERLTALSDRLAAVKSAQDPNGIHQGAGATVIVEEHELKDSSEIVAAIQQLMNDQQVLSHQLNAIMAECEVQQQASIDYALELTNTITPDDLLQQNRWTVLRVYLEAIGTGTLTPEQFAAISDIAHQCIFEGGAAVSDARMLYQWVEEKDFNDTDLCPASAERSAMKVSNTKAQTILITPNPAHDVLYIDNIEMGSESKATITLRNTYGQIVYQDNLRNKNQQINIRQIKSGLYIYTIEIDGVVQQSDKLVIIH